MKQRIKDKNMKYVFCSDCIHSEGAYYGDHVYYGICKIGKKKKRKAHNCKWYEATHQEDDMIMLILPIGICVILLTAQLWEWFGRWKKGDEG